MVRAPAQSPSPIEAYVEQMLPDLYGAFWMRRRITEEVTDHLLESVERLQMEGLTREEAEARAVQRFGSPSLVARRFAQMKGIGVPTTFTRWSGIALILGTLTLAGSLAAQAVSESFEHSSFGGVAAAGLALFALGLIGIYVRLRGQMGYTARLGARLMIAGFVIAVASSFLWFGLGALLGIVIVVTGAALYFTAMFRSGILPRVAAGLVIGGFVGALIAGGIANVMGFDGNALAAMGQVVSVVGFVWMGAFLFRESESEFESSDSGPAVALRIPKASTRN